MESHQLPMSQENSKRVGIFSHAWSWFVTLLQVFRNKIVNVAKDSKKLAQDDPRRVVHALKVGLALTLVSLLYYIRPFYNDFGTSGMWAVLSVVVVFEYTVGGTLSKGLNRGFATLLAGALGVGAQNLACRFGKQGEPIVLGILVFLLAAASTFSRFFPRIKEKYDYGVVIFILTFSLVSVSGYRVDEIITLAQQRLSTIVIGGLTCIFISIFIFPVWAGENLHNSVALNLEKLAKYLEGFGEEYFQNTADEENAAVSKNDKSCLQGYKSVLASKSTEESMATLASWEPGHGRFRFNHPWKQYLKIGALARQCAYQIEALDSYRNCDVQTPEEFKRKIQEPCTGIGLETGKTLKALASAIKTMTDPSPAEPHIENTKNAVTDLKVKLKFSAFENENLLAIVPAASVASLLIETAKCTEKIYESVQELSKKAHFKKEIGSNVSSEKPQLLHRGTVNPVVDSDSAHVAIEVKETSTDLTKS